MPGEVAPGDEAGQRLLLKAAHGAGIQPVFGVPGGQQMFRQHHVGNADARRKAAGTGGQVHHRAVGPGHALQAGQGAGVKAELGVVVVLDDVALAGAAGGPVQQLGPAAGRHGDPGGELVAGGNVTHGGPGAVQCIQRKAALVHGQAAAAHAGVFQHLQSAGVAGGLHGGGAVQQRGQQAQQIFQTGTHHHLMGTALHAAVFGQIIRQRLPQGKVTLGVAVGQQLRGGVQQFLLQPRPGAEGKQPRVHAPGGQVVPHRRFRRGGLRHGRGRRRAPCIRPDLRQRQIFLYIKAAALPGGKVALGSQHLVGGVHSVYRDRQFRRQPPLAGHPGAGGQGPGAHLSGQTAVQLFVQRHPGARLQCGGQMDHDRVLLFLQNVKLAP